MNLNQLQYFKILAQEEHYTRAAQMLSITQPSLSHAIAQLEEELGTRLFEKKGRNIVLTRYGKLFLPYVEESLKVLEEGVQRTRELNGSKEGIIHLAYIYTMGSNFTPKMVRNFLDAYPDYHIDFHFTVGTTGDILAGLKKINMTSCFLPIRRRTRYRISENWKSEARCSSAERSPTCHPRQCRSSGHDCVPADLF